MLSQEVMYLTSAGIPLATAGHMAPPNCKGAGIPPGNMWILLSYNASVTASWYLNTHDVSFYLIL